MKKIKNTPVSKMEALRLQLNEGKLRNSLASRKTNYKKYAAKAGMSYADYVMKTHKVSLDTFEDWKWSLPARKNAGSMPVKGTAEFAEYKRRASRKTYTKQLMEYVTACDPKCTTVEQFVEKHTDAADVDEFYSDEYNHNNKGCYKPLHYKFIADKLA